MEICRICGKKLGCINKSHLWHKHGMTIEEYRKSEKKVYTKPEIKKMNHLEQAILTSWGL